MDIRDMEHLKFYRTEDLVEEIDGSVTFKPVDAGESVERSIFVENIVNYEVNVSKTVINDETESVSIKNSFESLKPGEVKEIVLVFETDLTRLEALTIDFSLDYSFVVD